MPSSWALDSTLSRRADRQVLEFEAPNAIHVQARVDDAALFARLHRACAELKSRETSAYLSAFPCFVSTVGHAYLALARPRPPLLRPHYRRPPSPFKFPRVCSLSALQRHTENMGTSTPTSGSGCRGLETIQVLDTGEIQVVDAAKLRVAAASEHHDSR